MTSGKPRRHDAAADLFECSTCHAMKSRADFSRHARGLFGLEANCRACNKIKSKAQWDRTRARQLEAQRAANAARLALTPEPAKDAHDFPRRLVTARLASPYPHDPIELCVHPGAACNAQDGWALIAELHRANSCGGIVKGFASTVDKDADGLVIPRFARATSAAMFSAMIRHRTGGGRMERSVAA